MKNRALLWQAFILYALTRVLVTHSSGCALDVGFFFFSFSTDKVQSHHENVTIAFLSMCLARVSFPEGEREMG